MIPTTIFSLTGQTTAMCRSTVSRSYSQYFQKQMSSSSSSSLPSSLLGTKLRHAFQYQSPINMLNRETISYNQQQQQQQSRIRLFGSKIGSGIEGKIYIDNKQVAIPDINLERLHDTVSKVRKSIGYDTYDVSVYLVNDKEMRRTNYESRGIKAETDILSFPFHDPTDVVGILEAPLIDIPDYCQLGDMVIDVPYVIRVCIDDEDEMKKKIKALSSTTGSTNENEELVIGLDDDDDRGVSGAMSTTYNAEERIHMLIVHGMLHLVGYDHETDEDYEVMVEAEERILQELGLWKPPVPNKDQ